MAKTNWQGPKTGEIISPHISGLQGAVGKIEESIGMESVAETDIPLSEVFISNDDRCRIYEAPLGKRNWLLSPTPTIKKNGAIITDDFEVEYGGGAVVFTTPVTEDDVMTADATYTVPIKDKQLSTEDFTTEKKEGLAHLENNIKITKSPIGFPNRTDSIFSFDKSTRTFTIGPTAESYEVFFKDKMFIKDSPESVVIPNTTGLYYIYFNQDGILSASTNFPGLQSMIYVSYIYWNENQINTDLQFAIGDERHGTVMDKDTHAYLHEVVGSEWIRGLQLYGYELNDTTSNVKTRVSLTGGTVRDEDLIHHITHSDSPTGYFEQKLEGDARIPVMYKHGTDGTFIQDLANEYPFKNTSSGRVNFNEYVGDSWKQTEVTDGNFVAYWIVFTGLVEEPIKVVQGQRQDSSLSNAQANNDHRNINWGDMPFQEFKILYRIILQTSDTYTNDRKVAIRDVLDLRAERRLPSGGGGGIIPSAHSNLTGLDYASSGHTGFASESQLNDIATITSKLGTIATKDYEEGIWTPSLSFDDKSVGITYEDNIGIYTKIGRVIHWEMKLVLTNKGSSVGTARIGGLPIKNGAAIPKGSFIGATRNITVPSGANTLLSYLDVNATKLLLTSINSGGNMIALNNTHFSNNSYIFAEGSYSI